MKSVDLTIEKQAEITRAIRAQLAMARLHLIDLAKSVGCGSPYLSQVLNNQKRISKTNLRAIWKASGMKVRDFDELVREE